MLSKKWVFILILGLSLTALVVGSSFFPSLRLAPTQPQDSLSQSITVYAYGPNGLLSKQSGGEVEYYHTDSLGSSSLVTDKDGNRVYYSDYEPFGDSLHTSGEERYTYTGKELDASTGLYYYGARYYDSSLGRFISSDPLSGNLYNSQRLNRYTYVMNNPMVYTDPTGMEGEKPELSSGMKALAYVGQYIPAFIYDQFTGNQGRGTQLMAAYLYGSGKPREISISDDEWNTLISEAHKNDPWYDWDARQHPDFPSEEGWKFRTINSALFWAGGWEGYAPDVYNMLGETTLARRRLGEGYEYAILETFDFDGPLSLEFQRKVPRNFAFVADYLFSDILTMQDIYTIRRANNDPMSLEMKRILDTSSALLSGDTEWLREVGTPVPLEAKYFMPD